MLDMRANQPIEPSPRLVIEWNVADGVEQEVDRAFMEKVLTEALVDRKPAGPLELSLTVTTDEEIQELNRRYREVDSPTDVLSFPMLDFEHPEEPASLFPLPPGEP